LVVQPPVPLEQSPTATPSSDSLTPRSSRPCGLGLSASPHAAPASAAHSPNVVLIAQFRVNLISVTSLSARWCRSRAERRRATTLKQRAVQAGSVDETQTYGEALTEPGVAILLCRRDVLAHRLHPLRGRAGDDQALLDLTPEAVADVAGAIVGSPR